MKTALKFPLKKAGRLLACITALALIFGSITVFAANVPYSRLIKSISPKVHTVVLPGDHVTLEVTADSRAYVTAQIGEEVIELERGDAVSDGYSLFTGIYMVSKKAASGTNLGAITFTAEKGKYSEVKAMPGLTVGALNASVPDKPSGGADDNGSDGSTVKPQSGDMVVVTANYADVYIPVENDRGEEWCAPYYYQLPKGTIDYVAEDSEGEVNCLLASGRKVKYADIEAYDGKDPGDNEISKVAVSSSGGFTTVKITGDWNVPFNVEAKPFTYKDSTNTVSSFSPDRVVVTFDYTTEIKTGTIRFPSSSCFEEAEVYTRVRNGIAQGVLELTLKEEKYYGCYAEYTSEGKLALRFLNPVDDLEGARIVIDPGHGSMKSPTVQDIGASANGVKEHILNMDKAEALAEELESRGAEVYVLDTWKSTELYSLYNRMDAAIEWEPHLLVSVHHNTSSASTTARGVEVYYNTPFSVNLAKEVANSIFDAYQEMEYSETAVNRGHKFSEYAVNREKQFASILIEYGFITTAIEAEVLSDEENIPIFASYTADGIEAYLAG